jgi:hypothetical protein
MYNCFNSPFKKGEFKNLELITDVVYNISSKVNIQDSIYKQFMQIVDSIKYFYRHYSFSMCRWGAKLEYIYI